MIKEFEIIIISKKRTILKKFIALSFIIPFIYIAVFSKTLDTNEIHGILLGVFWTIWFCLMMISNFLISSYDVISKLVFYDNAVLLISKEYQLNEISEIALDLEDYFGKDFDIKHGRIPRLIEGINNYITIKFVNNEIERHRILIKSKAEINVINKILLFYKNKGVNVSIIIKGVNIIQNDL